VTIGARVAVMVAIAAGSTTTAIAEPKGSGAGVVERSRLEVAPGNAPIKQITIENRLGNVRIEGHDRDSIEIETRKQAPNEEALDRLRVSLIPNPDGVVRIMTAADVNREARPVGRGEVRIDLIVRAPRSARIDAVVSAGTLEVRNMDAGGELDTASGPISVRNVSGDLSTHTMSGRTELTQVFGSIDAQALASDVELDGIAGEQLVASVNRGKIAGRRVRVRQIELTTTDGKIVLEAEVALRGRVVVASMRGDLEIRLRRTGPLKIRARAVKVNLSGTSEKSADGWVVSELGHIAQGTIPALVEMRSQHGIINVAF
jgi:hypothetical protein